MDGVPDTRLDQCFKALMLDARVLSRTIGLLVPELRAVGPDGIMRMRSDGEISAMGTEMVSASGGMSADVMYRIVLPDGRTV